MLTQLKNEPKLVIFEPEHLDRIEMREHENKLVNRELMKTIALNGLYYSFICGDLVVAIGGYAEMWKDRYEVAMLPSIHFHKFVKSAIKLIRQHHDNFMADSGAKRLMTASRADPQTDKWMKVLKFECEGLMRNYSAYGDDYKIWARVV